MYKCEFCGKSVGPNQKCHKVLTQARSRIYNREQSVGWEIVKQKDACPVCVAQGIAVDVELPDKPVLPKRERKQVERRSYRSQDEGFYNRRNSRHRRRSGHDEGRYF